MVLDTILVTFTALVAQTTQDLQDLAQNPDFVAVLCRMLEAVGRGKDPIELLLSGKTDIELKRLGIGRTEKSYVSIISFRSSCCIPPHSFAYFFHIAVSFERHHQEV